MRDPKEEVSLTTTKTVGITLGITVVAVLVIGIFPSFLIDFAREAIAAGF
jgi:NADH:ubiquinone oxidoreductase subunit 2 (subunit N)